MPKRVQLNPGETLYKFELKNRIGAGSFGDVWLAHDRTISRDVAVKVLDEGVTIDERLSEARIGNHLDHANLVKMHYADVVKHNGSNLVIIAMDYHANGSILSEVNSGNFLPLPRMIHYITNILQGLEYLHELNLYHSDIKPGNLLIGDAGQGVLTDYGITCHSPGGQPVQPRNSYKLHIAPEILSSNQMNVQTDIYQTGLTAFRLLNGLGLIRDKFNRLGQAEYYKLVAAGKVIHPKDYQLFVPRNLKTVLNRAVNVDPGSRYQSAVDMRRALERLSYPGYWTTDANGNLIGRNDRYEFHYEEHPRTVNTFDFVAFKKNRDSGKETTIGDFSRKHLSGKERDDLKGKFMQWVVTGLK